MNTQLKEGAMSDKTCDRCGIGLPVSGGQIGWKVAWVKGLFCADCAGGLLYPGTGFKRAATNEWFHDAAAKTREEWIMENAR